jgi:hypothetical protein
MRLLAQTYQQFDFGPELGTTAGWRDVEIELAPQHTALVVMHAWDCGAPNQFPGWHRAVKYMPRANRILREIFPPLLTATRRSRLPVFHVVGGGRDYYSHLPGHRRVVQLASTAKPDRSYLQVSPDPIFDRLKRLRHDVASPGASNSADVAAGFAQLDFAAEARPMGDEGIAQNADQLAALCVAHQVNHLVYVGFAINWCLLMSPGGMTDMARHGCLCSTIREAVTAVENAESAAEEREKAQALWRVAVEFGFVFSLGNFLAALKAHSSPV